MENSKQENVDEEDINEYYYLIIRFIEILCIDVFMFGFIWGSTELLKLTLPQFIMLYGGIGVVLSEGIARIIHNSLKKKRKQEEVVNNG